MSASAEYYRVLRPLPGPHGERFMPGQIVDGSRWRNAARLVQYGQLLPVPPVAPATPPRKETTHA